MTALGAAELKGHTMPRWLILLIAVLVVLVIAILIAEHVKVGIH